MAKAAGRVARRPFIDAAQAAELLGCDPRTARKMVCDGRLEGEKVRSANDRYFQWRIFTDQPVIQRAIESARVATVATAVPAPSEDRLAGENAELRAQLAELHAAQAEQRARSAEAQNAHIVAALHAMNEVLEQFQKGAELAQKSAELSQQSNAAFQAGSSTMSKVMGALLDTVALTSTPDSPEGL